GTIAFGMENDAFVAVFFLQTSERNPLDRGDPAGTLELLNGVPAQLRTQSDETLQYLLQEVGGEAVPVITSAFWSDPKGPLVTADEPWPNVVENGASLVRNQLLPIEVALGAWTNDLELSPTEARLVEALFRSRLAVAGDVT